MTKKSMKAAMACPGCGEAPCVCASICKPGMKCGAPCYKLYGLVLSALALAFLLRDWGIWNFWNIQPWSVLFLLFGLHKLCKKCPCPHCSKQ